MNELLYNLFTFYCSSIKSNPAPSYFCMAKLYLHSTVVLLKGSRLLINRLTNINLHSTVVLLKVKLGPGRSRRTGPFTFYCSSIKSLHV